MRTIKVSEKDVKDLINALHKADRAAGGDSNDREIARLQDVRDHALGILKISSAPDLADVDEDEDEQYLRQVYTWDAPKPAR